MGAVFLELKSSWFCVRMGIRGYVLTGYVEFDKLKMN